MRKREVGNDTQYEGDKELNSKQPFHAAISELFKSRLLVFGLSTVHHDLGFMAGEHNNAINEFSVSQAHSSEHQVTRLKSNDLFMYSHPAIKGVKQSVWLLTFNLSFDLNNIFFSLNRMVNVLMNLSEL